MTAGPPSSSSPPAPPAPRWNVVITERALELKTRMNLIAQDRYVYRGAL